MPPPYPVTAYLSVDPLEPVLVFRSETEAKEYQAYFNGLARIYPDQPNHTFLPIPPGLKAVRTAVRGDVAFEFKTASQAEDFETVIIVGRRHIRERLHGERYRRTVYVGQQLVR